MSTHNLGYCLELTGGGANAMDNIGRSTCGDGDLTIVATSDDEVYFYKFNASDSSTEASPATIEPDDAVASSSGTWQRCTPYGINLPRGYLNGFNIAYSTNHDIEIGVGKARSDDDTENIELTTALTKQADSTWSTGSAGMFSTGKNLANNTWYHVYAIKNVNSRQVDVVCSTVWDPTTDNSLPANWTKKVHIHSFKTKSGSTVIMPFKHVGKAVIWTSSQPADVHTMFDNAASTQLTLASVPPDYRVKAHLNVYTGGCFGYVYDGFVEGTTVNTGSVALTNAGDTDQSANQISVITTTAGKIRAAMESSAKWLDISVRGYEKCT